MDCQTFREDQKDFLPIAVKYLNTKTSCMMIKKKRIRDLLKKMKKSVVLIVVLFAALFFAKTSWADTHTAASCSAADVTTAITAASTGDTVAVPAGSCSWSSGLSITKGITLQGAGIGNTVITYGGSAASMVYYNPTTPSLNNPFRLTGFTLDCNNVAGTYGVQIRQNSDTTNIISNIRIDNNRITKCKEGIKFLGMIYGLVDNNQFANNEMEFEVLGLDTYSWVDPLEIGSSKYIYVETNTFTGSYGYFFLSGQGARWVFRYNNVDLANCAYSILDAHGNLVYEYPACNWLNNNRGIVGHEIYENTFTNLNRGAAKLHDLRGGTGIVFNNAVTGTNTGCNNIINIREEDDNSIGPCYPVKTTYPGYDPVKDTYIWGNTQNSNRHCLANSDSALMIIEQQDYWADTQVWGTTPTTYWTTGLSSSRGSTCTSDNVYWETDTRKLYRCVGTNNWRFIYTPYTYPHPLRGEGGPADKTPPTIPTNLQATAISSSQINLAWTVSTDPAPSSGLAGYRIYRCQGAGCTPSTEIATSTPNSYSNTGLSPSTTYVYRVAAYDATGNPSNQSTSASATTQPSTTLKGDVNQDGSVNVLDVQACVNDILGVQDYGSSADANKDGKVDILDVQGVVNIILGL